MKESDKELVKAKALEISNKYNIFIQELDKAHDALKELKDLLTQDTLDLFNADELDDLFRYLTYACVHINSLCISEETQHIAEMVNDDTMKSLETNLNMN